MENDLAGALVMMANAIQNLADAQVALIENTTAIRRELRDQSKTLARAMRDQKARASKMVETARGLQEELSNRATTPSP